MWCERNGKGFKATKQFQKAIYNTCCTNVEALSCAKRFAELKDAGSRFKDSQEFAKFCKSGYTGENPIFYSVTL